MQALSAGSPNDDTQIYCYINYDELILGRYIKSRPYWFRTQLPSQPKRPLSAYCLGCTKFSFRNARFRLIFRVPWMPSYHKWFVCIRWRKGGCVTLTCHGDLFFTVAPRSIVVKSAMKSSGNGIQIICPIEIINLRFATHSSPIKSKLILAQRFTQADGNL